MIISGSGFRAFSDYDLSGVFVSMDKKIKDRVQGSEQAAEIDQLVEAFRLDPVIFDEDTITISDREEMIPAEYFPNNFSVDRGERYAKKVVRYHLPFSGYPDLLRCRPSAIIMRSEKIMLDGKEICFDVINWSNDAAQLKRDSEDMLRYLREQNSHVTVEIEKYNGGLKPRIVSFVEEAKKKNQQNDDFMLSLGVPRKPNV